MDQILASFVKAWRDPSQPPRIADFLPQVESTQRESALREFIKIDLDNRWRTDDRFSKNRVTLEHYFEQFPILGAVDSCPTSLIEHEYRVRALCGDRPGLAEYQVRFRAEADRLPQLLQEVDETIAAGTKPDRTSVERTTERNRNEKRSKRRKPRISGNEFLRHAIESELLTESEVESALQNHRHADSTAEDYARFLVRERLLTAYQAQAIYKGRGRTLTLGNYRILDKLGEGGMGLVLKAEHRRMKRIVALKVLSPSVSRSEELTARFQREVRAAARLDHPNIVTAFDADEAGRTHFLVMQFVDGIDLASRVKQKGPLAVDKAVDCVRQTAMGLQYAHEQGVVHRDIKPANLLLDSNGAVKILDMGLARLDTADNTQAELTSTGAVMGTVDYMAPEQALSTKNADERSDIYSLGITLWYLLTGRPAYHGDSMMARLLAHREAEIPSLSAACEAVPPELDAVFRSMVAKSPQDRPQTMSQVIENLDAALNSPTSSPSVSLGPSEDDKLDDFLQGLSTEDKSVSTASSETMPLTQAPEDSPGPPKRVGPESTLSPVNSVPARSRSLGGASRKSITIIAGSVLLLGVVLAVVFWPRNGDEPSNDPRNVGEKSSPAGKDHKRGNGNSRNKQGVPPDPAPGRAKAPFDAKEAATRQSAWAKHLGVPVEFTNAVGIKFRLIPPGEYERGMTAIEIKQLKKELPNPKSPTAALLETEGPRHRVFVTRPFYMGITEITQNQFRQVTGWNPSKTTQAKPGDNYPVNAVSWDAAVEFCKRLNEHARISPSPKVPSDGYRLPTEAEWEYACRAGTATRFWSGDSDRDLISADWIQPNGAGKMQSVGRLDANPFGLHDLHGNLQEWCHDGWEALAYTEFQSQDAVDPKGPDFQNTRHVVKGGHFGATSWASRSGFRSPAARSTGHDRVGFRIVLAVEWVQILAARKPVVRKSGDKPQRAVAPFLAAEAAQHQRNWAQYLGVSQAYKNSVGMRFELIPPGEFRMGSSDADVKALAERVASTIDRTQILDEAPQRKVTLTKACYLGTYEVTIADYQAVMKSNPNAGPRKARHPVGMVPWARAVAFCNALSVAEKRRPCYVKQGNDWVIDPKGSGYRLPTEAEWEFACRAGTTTRWHFGNDPKLAVDYGFFGATEYTSHEVGQKRPNAFGLYDMLGNHWEWCHDYYAEYPNSRDVTDPAGPATGKNRVVRGGFNIDSVDRLRSARRRWNDPGPTYPAAGFRVLLVIPASK